VLSGETARILVDGAIPGTAALERLALESYGHFTAMQVRGGAVRGLALHLARLDAASIEMFGAAADGERVRGYVRQALDGTADASVRVYVLAPDRDSKAADGHPSVTVTIRPPGELRPARFRLRSVPYQRSLAHIKHLGDFGQAYYRQRVASDGFDEALLTGPDGLISEGCISNVGCIDGDVVCWPAAPLLAGVTMQLLQQRLAAAGISWRQRPIRLADLAGMTGMFVTSARGIAPVIGVDDLSLPVASDTMARLAQCYDSVPWDPV
jgi:branched-subunit amino acid aminotransferase/4-amino-4-deoxychorismate lyase